MIARTATLFFSAMLFISGAQARSKGEELENACDWGRLGVIIDQSYVPGQRYVYKSGSCVGDLERKDADKANALRERWEYCDARNNCGAWGYHHGQGKRDYCMTRCLTDSDWPNCCRNL